MPTPLTKREQRAVAKAIAPRIRRETRKAVRKSAQKKNQKGKGILGDIGKALGSVGKALGPSVLKHIVQPVAKEVIVKKLAGKGHKKGKGLRLAGQR